MYIQQITTEAILSILLALALLALLAYVLKDEPSSDSEHTDNSAIITRNDDIQADYDIKLTNTKIRIGE